MNRNCLILVLALLSVLPTGCGSNGLSSVSGSVTYQGKPATGAAVHFHREGETPEEAANFPIGLVDEDGNFSLQVNGVGYGAAPGKYKVLVIWVPEQDLNAPPSKTSKKGRPPTASVGELRRDPKSVADRLKFRYFNIDKPLLHAEIKPGTNKLDPFELKD